MLKIIISPLLASASPALGGVLALSVGLVGSVWQAVVVWGVEEVAEWQPAAAPAAVVAAAVAAAAVAVVKELGCVAAPDVCAAPHATFCLAP